MPARNIKLTERYDEFVAEQVTSGRYRSASEVMRAGLRLLEQQTREEQERLSLLRKLASEGFDQLDQGQGVELHGPRQIEDFIARVGERAIKRGPMGVQARRGRIF